MNAQLKVVPPAAEYESDDLRDAAISYAEESAALLQGLARELRRSADAAELRPTLLEHARKSSALMGKLIDNLCRQ
jgi:hypothetical protein